MDGLENCLTSRLTNDIGRARPETPFIRSSSHSLKMRTSVEWDVVSLGKTKRNDLLDASLNKDKVKSKKKLSTTYRVRTFMYSALVNLKIIWIA
jgi:hypothetical protein